MTRVWVELEVLYHSDDGADFIFFLLELGIACISR